MQTFDVAMHAPGPKGAKGDKGDKGDCGPGCTSTVKQWHWAEALSCKLHINIEAKAVIQSAATVDPVDGKQHTGLVSTVIMHGYISTKDQFASNAPINLAAYSGWWSQVHPHAFVHVASRSGGCVRVHFAAHPGT